MATSTVTDWDEIEADPDFSSLPQESRVRMFDDWEKSFNRTLLEDADLDKVKPEGLNRFAATNAVRRRKLAGEDVSDPDAAAKTWAEQKQAEAKLAQQSLKDYADVEDKAFRLDDARSMPGVDEFGRSSPEWDKNVESASKNLQAAESKFTPEVREQAKAANEALKGERKIATLQGNIYTDPALVLNKDEFRQQVLDSDASPEAKALKLASFQSERKRFADEALRTLRVVGESPIPGAQDFPSWEASQPKEVYRLPPEDKALQYLREMQKRGDIRKLTSAIGTGILQGGVDIATQAVGTAAMLTGKAGNRVFPTQHPFVKNPDGSASNVMMAGVGLEGREYVIPTMVDGKQLSIEEAVKVARKIGLNKYPSFSTAKEADDFAQKNHGSIDESGYLRDPSGENLSKIAAKLSRASGDIGAAQELEGDMQATGGTFAGGVARLGTNMAPMLLPGGAVGGIARLAGAGAGAATAAAVGASALTAGAQTAGSQFGEVYDHLRRQGSTHEQAFGVSRNAAVLSGAVTTALTALGGATGVESLLRQGGKDLVKSRLLSALKAVPGGAAAEIAEELPDEYISQLVSAFAKDPNVSPSQVTDEFAANAPDLMLQIAALGGAGAGVGRFRETTTDPAKAREAEFPTAGAPPPLKPQDYENRAAGGQPIFNEKGDVIGVAPPGATPEETAAYREEIRSAAEAAIPEVVEPIDGVDPAITEEMDARLAAGKASGLANQTLAELERQKAVQGAPAPVAEAPAPKRPLANLTDEELEQRIQDSSRLANETAVEGSPDAAFFTNAAEKYRAEKARRVAATTQAATPSPTAETLGVTPPPAPTLETPEGAARNADMLRQAKARLAGTEQGPRIGFLQPSEVAPATEAPPITPQGAAPTTATEGQPMPGGSSEAAVAPKKGDLVTVSLGGREYPKTRIINVINTLEGVRYQVDVFGSKFVPESSIVSIEKPVIKDATKIAATPQLVRQLGDIAVKNKQPLDQGYIDSIGGNIPQGYVKQGDLYVFQPEPSPQTTTVATPTETAAPLVEWTPQVNAPAAFTANNGQKLVGTVQSIEGGKAVVSFLWNGNENTQTVPVSQLARPVASLTEPPKYQYTQEQNTRKMGKHFPTAPGVYANYDFRKAFASMAKDTSLSRIYRMLAKVMSKMPVFANMDLHVVADGDVRYAGEYSFSNGRSAIAVNLRQVGRGKVDALGTILHEALHHLTLAKVRDPQNAWENEIIDKLDTIRGRVLEYAQQNGLGERFDYELGTVEEFISAVFTRPDFQNFLASIPDSFAPSVAVGKFRSVLSEVFRRLAELVTGEMVAKGSTMEQAVTTVLALFETPHRVVETGKLEALNAARSGTGTAKSVADDAMDAEYMAAVEAGDVAKQQAMVDEAAKAAGYTERYDHGTPNKDFTTFNLPDPLKTGVARMGPGIYGAAPSDIQTTSTYAKNGRVITMYVNMGKVVLGDSLNEKQVANMLSVLDADKTLRDGNKVGRFIDQYRNSDSLNEMWGLFQLTQPEKWYEAVGKAGIEGATRFSAGVENGEIVLFKENKVKSADPITRDEQGNVIPLSQRFNPKSNSTLYSPADDSEPFYSKLAQVVEQKMPNRADAQTIKGIINNTQTGIKAEEIKWSGIVPWLESQTGPVTKQAVLDYLASDGAVRLEEVVAGPGIRQKAAKDFKRVGDYFKAQGLRLGVGSGWDDIYISKSSYDGERMSPTADMLPLIEEAKAASKILNGPGMVSSKFDQYQLPGGENYREVVLAMPFAETPVFRKVFQLWRNGSVIAQGDETAANRWRSQGETDIRESQALNQETRAKAEYTSSHFPDVPNYVAHMRMNDRTDAEGKPGAFIEEIQSDRHQAGREKGYQLTDTEREIEWRRIVAIPAEQRTPTDVTLLDRLKDELRSGVRTGIPDAPFRTTWPLQMFKRALADAVAAGKQWIGWTTGETQAERYDLSKQVESIRAERRKSFWALDITDKSGNTTSQQVELEKLPDFVGKDLARKIDEEAEDNPDGKEYSGLDLKVGGEGMKGFYDNILPKEIGKYVKQWGASVVKESMGSKSPWNLVTDTNSDGQIVLFDTATNRYVADWDKETTTARSEDAAIFSRPAASSIIAATQSNKPTPIWRVDITPQMKAGVRSGQTLFSPADESDQRESDAVLGVMMEDDRFEEGVKMYDKAKRRQLRSPPQPSANTSTPPRFTNSAQFAAAFEAAYLRGDFDYFLEALKQADRHIYVPEMKKYINASKLGYADAAERLEWFRHAIAGTVPPNVKPQAKTPPQPQPSAGAPPPPVGTPPPPPAATPPPKAGVSNRPMLTLNTAAMGLITKMLGANVRINTLLRRARGRIKLSMADGSEIELSKQLFKDPVQAAKTLAHEIGHLFDFLPASGFNKSLAHKLAPLGDFRKVFGNDLADWFMDGGKKIKPSKITQLIKSELVTLSKKWRGDFSPSDKYRGSGKELYADFISAILNDPMWTAKNAPYATLGFLNALEQKPEVDQAYQLVVSLVQGGSLYKALAEANRGKSTTALERLIAKSSALMRTKKVVKDAARGLYRSMFGSWLPTAIRDGGIWKSYWKRLKNMGTSGDYNWAQEEASQFAVRQIAQFDNDMAKAVGIPLKLAGIDPDYLQRLQTNNRIIHERRRVGTLIEEDPAKARQLLKWMVDAGLLGKDVQDEVDATPDDGLYKKTAEVIYKLHASGDGFERALKAARRKGAPADAEKALYAFDVSGFMLNPDVFTMESAEADNADIEKTLGPDQFAELERINEGYHDLIKRTMVQAYKLGLFRQSTWDDVIVPNFGVYVPFMPIKYFTGYVKGGVGPSRVGTANDLMAPHVVGIRKMHALINRMQRQKQALLLIDFFNNTGLHNELEPVEDENFDRQKAEELVKQSKNTISFMPYWDQGEYKWLKINGTDAVPLVMNSDPDDLAAVYQLLKANTRLWRMNFTIFSIGFNVANTLRNVVTPFVDVGPKAGYKAAKQLLSVFPQMGKWVWAKMAGRDMTSIVAASISMEHAMHKPGMPVSKELQEFYDRGILQPSPDVASLRMTQEELARSVMGALSSPELLLHGGHKAAKDLNWFDKTLRQYFYSAVDVLSFIGSVSEAAPKIAAYRALKEKKDSKGKPAFTDAQATYLATLEGIPRPGVGGSDNALWEMVLLFFRIMGQSWRKHLIMATAPQTRAGFLMRHMLFQGAKFGLQAMAANGVIDYLIALGAAAAAGGDDDDIEKYKQVDWAEAVSRQSDHKLSRGGVGPLICWVLPDGSIEPPYGHKSIPTDWVPIMPRLPGTEFSRELDPMSYYATSKTIAPTIAPVNDDVFWNDYMRGLVSLNPAFDVVSDAMSIVGPTPPRDSYRGREKVEQRVWDEGYIARMLGLGEHHLRSFGIGSNPYDTPLPGAWNVLKKPGFKTLLSSDNMVGVREERRARREDDLTSSFAQNMVGEKFGTLKNTFNRLKGKATPRTNQEEEIYNILKPVMSKQFYGTQKNDGMYDVLQSYARMKAQGLQDTPGGKLLKAEADQVVKDLEQTADELQKPLEYLRTHTLP